MEITRQADYAVRAVLALAMGPQGKRVLREDVAAQQARPPAFLTKIFARLAAEGILDTQRGVKGGVLLARQAEQITLLDVVEAIDGPILMNRCTRRPGECARDGFCVVHPVWVSIRDDFRRRLADVHFGMLAESARATVCRGASPAAPNMEPALQSAAA